MSTADQTQSDTDTYILNKVDMNLVSFMKRNKYSMTNRDHFFYEDRGFYMGLPELAQYWMVRNSVSILTVPTPAAVTLLFMRMNCFSQWPFQVTRVHAEGLILNDTTKHTKGIAGPIFKHCIPPDTTGLKTANVADALEDGRVAWAAHGIAGNFNIFRCSAGNFNLIVTLVVLPGSGVTQ